MSIQQNSFSKPSVSFAIGQRVQVVNLDADGQPAAYHGCAGIIRMLFKHEGEPCARIAFNTPTGNIEKKIHLSKLQPITKFTEGIEQPAPVYPTNRTERAYALPAWADRGTAWTLGSELQVGDTIYFSHIANPRVLNKPLTPEHWQSTVLVDYYGMVRRISGQLVEVDPTHWYVVKRAVR
jgi:hypothetical protein